MTHRSPLFLALTLTGAGLSIAASRAAAQLPRFELIPKAGVLVPAIELGNALSADELVQIEARLKPAFVAGLNLQYNLPTAPASIRVSLDYVPFTRVEGQPAACEILTGPGCRTVDADARYYKLTADALVRPTGEGKKTYGYFLVGVGVKRYEFADMTCAVGDIVCTLLDDFTQNQTTLTIHVGIGVNFQVGPVRTGLEVSDGMSRHKPTGQDIQGKVQQDLFTTAAVRIGLF